MPLEIIRNDITKVHADAIVNPANPSLLGDGGVDGAIHKAAGPQLLVECRELGGCKTGQAIITKGYNLPAKYVIHIVGPIWKGGKSNEEELLRDCYSNSLNLAKEYKLQSIAFPLVSTGAYGYPKNQALSIANSVIGGFLLENDMKVYLVVYDKTTFVLSERLFSSIAEYIDDNYVEKRKATQSRRIEKMGRARISKNIIESSSKGIMDFEDKAYLEESLQAPSDQYISPKMHKLKLREVINNLDETFSQMLLRLIDEKEMTDAQTYKKANVDRKLFSKIRNDIDYKPSKVTVIAFAISLELSLDETKDLLFKAGFALSNSSKFDVIIQYFIEIGNYNIFQINEALFAFDQKLLGA